MFKTISSSLTAALSKLKGNTVLSEANINEALVDIREALLEADVALSVVKQFTAEVKQRALGTAMVKNVTADQLMIKIVHDYLTELLGPEDAPLHLTQSIAPILVVGLQGSGKTTFTAKLAAYLNKSRKTLMVSLDVYRPAAQEQLQILATQHQLAVLPIVPGEKPLAIAKRGLKYAAEHGFNTVIYDTAGRLHIDDELMAELRELQKALKPDETLLVADAMIGQDAVNVAREFKQQLPLTGIVLNRADGDSRGGACLSMKAITGCPIKFLGVGEKVEDLNLFHPERMAGRILGMGDIVSFVEHAIEHVEAEEAAQMEEKFRKGRFDLNDMLKQMESIGKMGGFQKMLSFIPGIANLADQLQNTEVNKDVAKSIAIIRSMTKKERRNPELLNSSRRARVARGAGTDIKEVNVLLKKFSQMQSLVKVMGGMMGKGGTDNKLAQMLPGAGGNNDGMDMQAMADLAYRAKKAQKKTSPFARLWKPR